MNIKVSMIGAALASTLALAGCASTSSGYAGAPPVGSAVACYDCGTVTRIETLAGTGGGSGVAGAVIGGLVGAAAGRELTDDESRGRQNTATVVGAAAGAATGAAIQRNVSGGGTQYNVYVRMNDGRTTVVTQNDIGAIREGSRVRIHNGRAWIQ